MASADGSRAASAEVADDEQLIYQPQQPSTFTFDPSALGNNSESDDEGGLEFEQVGGLEDLADAPRVRQAEAEEGAGPQASGSKDAGAGPSAALEIILEKANIPQLKDKRKAAKRAQIPGSDRKSRIDIHNVQLLCLLIATKARSRLLFHDQELQCRILSMTPMSIQVPFQTAKSLPSSLDRSRAFEAALQDLVSWWWRSFDIDSSIPGLETVTFAQAVLKQPVPELPLDQDDSLTDKQKRKILAGIPGDHIRGAKSLSLRAVEMAGSKDMSPQLFVALCSAMEIPARLVVSLQPLDWKSSGGLKLPDEEDEESQAEKSSDLKGKGKAKAKGAPRAKKQAPTGASKLAKKAGLNNAAQSSRFASRKKTPSAKGTTDEDSDLEMEEVRVGSASTSSPARTPGGGFMADQADISEQLRHAGPAPTLRRSKVKIRDFEKSPSPDLKELSRKPVIWVEVYNRALKEWITVDVTRKRIRCQGDMEPNTTDEKSRMTYVVAVEQDGSIRDVTAKYVKAFGAVTVKKRPPTPRGEPEWWDRVLSLFKRPRVLDRDREEERQMNRFQNQEAMPTSIAGFKDHPLFALERHLKREEALHPRKQLGLIKDEAVFPRSSVVTVKSAETWMREGMKVKEGEQSLKSVKSRAVTINKRRAHELARSEGREEDTMQGLYARWQTVKSIPPPVVDGIVPRNGYGNLDLFAPHMLPRGGVHLPYKGSAKVAKQLGIDFAEAITGFEFHKRRAVPRIEGIVVAQENEDVVMEAYWETEHAAVEKAHNKRQEECLKRWKKLIAGLAIRNRLANEYNPIEEAAASLSSAAPDVPFEDSTQFQEVIANEAEKAAQANPQAASEAKSTTVRLTHNGLPPSQQQHHQRSKKRAVSISSDEPSDSEVEVKPEPKKAAPKRAAAEKKAAQVVETESESDVSDSEFEEEVKPAVKRPRRGVAAASTVATTRAQRTTSRAGAAEGQQSSGRTTRSRG